MTTQEQVKDVVSPVLADKADKGRHQAPFIMVSAGGLSSGNTYILPSTI